MTIVFQREIEALKGKALSLAAKVEDSLRGAIRSIRDRDAALAERVIVGDSEIDRIEVQVEEECLKVLALHQPVAIDLRFVVAVIKLNNELERIGDLATDIAERAQFLTRRDPVRWPPDLSTMAERVQVMLKKSIDALVNLDVELARDVRASDDEVDDLHRGMFVQVQGLMRDNPDQIEDLLPLLSISRYLERIADHATNIAEDVIYLVEGEIVRHAPAPR